jgi:hypothetical protein
MKSKDAENGLCLSQLPEILKLKQGYHFNSFDYGFNKVKDLVKSLDDIIEIRLLNKNHPFIYLKTQDI